MNKPDNVLMMLEWAEISGECVDCNQAEGQDIAQRKYESYNARRAAQVEVRIIQSWNLTALRGIVADVAYLPDEKDRDIAYAIWDAMRRKASVRKIIDFRIKDDKYTQQVYRDMVRANARAA